MPSPGNRRLPIKAKNFVVLAETPKQLTVGEVCRTLKIEDMSGHMINYRWSGETDMWEVREAPDGEWTLVIP